MGTVTSQQSPSVPPSSFMHTTHGNDAAQQSNMTYPETASSTPHQASYTSNRPQPTHTQAPLRSGWTAIYQAET
eukprot:9883741-Prorocentrum_lima.AAC.1